MYFYPLFGFTQFLDIPTGVLAAVRDVLWAYALIRGGAEVVDGICHHLGVNKATIALWKHPGHREWLQITAQLTQTFVPGL